MTDFELIYGYSRAQVLEDGEQMDVSTTAREAGIRFPVFLARAVFNAFVSVPEDVIGQDEKGRLWDILWMLRCAIKSEGAKADHIAFEVFVRNDNRAPRRQRLNAMCAAMDIDDPQPAITVMLPRED